MLKVLNSLSGAQQGYAMMVGGSLLLLYTIGVMTKILGVVIIFVALYMLLQGAVLSHSDVKIKTFLKKYINKK